MSIGKAPLELNSLNENGSDTSRIRDNIKRLINLGKMTLFALYHSQLLFLSVAPQLVSVYLLHHLDMIDKDKTPTSLTR